MWFSLTQSAAMIDGFASQSVAGRCRHYSDYVPIIIIIIINNSYKALFS